MVQLASSINSYYISDGSKDLNGMDGVDLYRAFVEAGIGMNHGWVRKERVLDGWGNDYVVKIDKGSRRIIIRSFGSDVTSDNDDILRESELFSVDRSVK